MTTERNSESSSSGRCGSGNFAKDPQKASELGRKGGQHSHQGAGGPGDDRQDNAAASEDAEGSESEPESTPSMDQRRGGSGSFANDPGRRSDAGR